MEQKKLHKDTCAICRFSGATEFEDGWFHVATDDHPWKNCRELYDTAVQEIEARRVFSFDSMGSVGYGWRGILTTLVHTLRLTDPEFKIHQIKEKFGGLRFYVGGMSVVGHGLISWAETRSESVCEACGSWGVLRENGWWKTLCDDCNELREKDQRPWIFTYGRNTYADASHFEEEE